MEKFDWELEVWFKSDKETADRIKQKVKEALKDEAIDSIHNRTWD